MKRKGSPPNPVQVVLILTSCPSIPCILMLFSGSEIINWDQIKADLVVFKAPLVMLKNQSFFKFIIKKARIF